MTLTIADFTEVDGGGYFTRVVAPGLTEVVRADGYGFGSTSDANVANVVAADRENPAPATGGSLAANLAPAELPEPPPLPEGVTLSTDVVPDAIPPVVEQDAAPVESPAPTPARVRFPQ